MTVYIVQVRNGTPWSGQALVNFEMTI